MTGSNSVAGSGNVTVPMLQCSELVALPSQQSSVFATLKAHLRIGTWVAQQHQTMSPLVQPGLHKHGASCASSKVSPTEEDKAVSAKSGPGQPESIILNWHDMLPKHCQNIL